MTRAALRGSVPAQELVEAALSAASADGTVAIAHRIATTNLRFALNKLTTSGTSSGTSLTVVSIRDGAYGTARAEVTDPGQVRDVVRRAEEIASRSKPAPDAYDLVSIEEAGGLASTFDVDFSPRDPLDFYEGVTPSLREAFAESEAAKQVLFGYAEFGDEVVLLGTSTGVRAGYREQRAHLGMTAKTDDASRSVWTGQTGRTIADIDPAGAQRRCRAMLELARDRRDLEPGRYKCVLSPSCVADMLLWMYWLMSQRDADEGKSVFSDRKRGGSRIGEKLYPESVRLWSDPDYRQAGCLPFVVTSVSHSLESVFDNGYPVRKTEWVVGGVQEKLVSTRRYAADKGLSPAPMAANLVLQWGDRGDGRAPGAAPRSEPEAGPEPSSRGDAPGTIPHPEIDDVTGEALGESAPLVSAVDRGLYVNCLWYIRLVDPQTALLTGLTRDGVYLIEDGRVVAEVNNFRFNQSPVEMLARAQDGGATILATPREFDDVGIWVAAPPLLVDGFNMSTVSAAV